MRVRFGKETNKRRIKMKTRLKDSKRYPIKERWMKKGKIIKTVQKEVFI
jgi:hypothetical protein